MEKRPTMADMYQYMKEVLEYFGLQFGEMHEVNVTYHADAIEFSYGNQSIRITTNYSKLG